MRFVGISFISFVFCATAWLLHSPLAATEKSEYSMDIEEVMVEKKPRRIIPNAKVPGVLQRVLIEESSNIIVDNSAETSKTKETKRTDVAENAHNLAFITNATVLNSTVETKVTEITSPSSTTEAMDTTPQYLGNATNSVDSITHSIVINSTTESAVPEISEPVYTTQAMETTSYIPGYTIDVVSAGYKDENFAGIIINGRDYSANERGYNVAVINPQTGEIVSRSFDTYLEPAEDMARFLFSLADGSIIAIAVKDEASWHADWRHSDVRFMTLLGAGSSDCPVEIGYRDSWALITKKVPSRDLLPSWFRCSHKASTQGIATASASFDIAESATNSAESLTDSIVVNATIESPLPEIYTATNTMETTTTMTVTRDYAIEVASAGYNDGNFARIIINGHDYSANERGYNVAVINPRTGEIVSRSFDTYLHPAATMTDFLYSLAAGSIIVIAVRDEASWHADWRQRDVRLMTLLGAGSSDCPVEIGYRHSFALVTKKVARRELLPSWTRCDHKPSSQGMASLSVAIEITEEEFANGTSTEQEGETSEYPSVPPVDPLRAEEVIEILAHLSHPEARCLSNCHCSKLQLLHAACIEGQCDPTLLGNLSSEYPQLNQQWLASLYDSDLDIISCRGCVDRCLDRTGVCGFPNPGWKYMITPSLQGWNESREWCQNNFGGDLAYIGISNYKMRLKVAAALHFPTGVAWLGLSDLGSEGEWKWIDGTPVDDSSAKWATGEPNNWWEIEHCGAFYNKMYYEMYNIPTSGTHLLNDAPCDWRYPAVCAAPCTSADAAE